MTFEYTRTEDGFRIRDTIENASLDVATGRPVDPTDADTARFRFPLDEAVTVLATELEFAATFGVFVRRPDGTLLETGMFERTVDLEPATYEIETTYQGFRLYLFVEGSTVRTVDGPTTTTLAFDRPTTVTLGVRSNHERPAGVVTTARDPRELMRAISTFGSALKTFSPERSWPTLRGHPPELAVRGQTAIPDDLEPPDTGITLQIPPSYSAVYMATPVAYYLGATLQPGLDPRLDAAGSTYELDESSLAGDIHDLLRHCFLLDCVVRTVGLYPMGLTEGTVLEDRVTLDHETLYDLPLDERTARYLDVPLETTRDLFEWTHVADVDPVPLNAEALPYLAFRLAAIRSPAESGRITDPAGTPPRDETSRASAPDTREFLPNNSQRDRAECVAPAPFEGQHHLWVADGIPVDGVKPTLGSFLRSANATPSDESIEMHVVYGDDSAGTHTPPEPSRCDVEVTVHEEPTTRELQDLLRSDVDFLYYVGEATDAGLSCLDGALDVRTLPRTGVSSFFFDGTGTYREGLALVRVGGVGGIVALDDYDRGGQFGPQVAALLDHGFSLSGTMAILSRLAGTDAFAVVGDGDHQLRNPATVPTLYEPGTRTRTGSNSTPDTGSRTLTATCFATLSHRIGSIIEFANGTPAGPSLIGVHPRTMPADEFVAFSERLEAPILADGDLHWPETFTPADVRDYLR